MTRERIPEEPESVARRPGRGPRSTPDLIVEWQARSTALTLAAIAVAQHDRTQFVFASDDNSLSKLDGVVGARIRGETVECCSHRSVECQDNSRAVAYLQGLRVPFLTLLRTHADRMPDNPRMN